MTGELIGASIELSVRQSLTTKYDSNLVRCALGLILECLVHAFVNGRLDK